MLTSSGRCISCTIRAGSAMENTWTLRVEGGPLSFYIYIYTCLFAWRFISFPCQLASWCHDYGFYSSGFLRRILGLRMKVRPAGIWNCLVIYLDNTPMQNYRSKSETAIIVAGGCRGTKISPFPLFLPFQSAHCGFLIFFVFFSLFRLYKFFRRFNTGKHMQRQTHTQLAHRQKNISPASNNSWKGNNFTYIGRCRYESYPYFQDDPQRHPYHAYQNVVTIKTIYYYDY